jgi:hypothetical protein
MKVYNEPTTLPDDYTQVIEDSKIDRPVVVEVPTIKLTAQGRGNVEKMTIEERNFLINRLLVDKTFRQILPLEDQADDSMPANTLVLRYEAHRIVVSAAPYLKVPLAPTTTEMKVVLRDLQYKNSVTTEGLMKLSPHESGQIDLSCRLDSKESEDVELTMSEPDFPKKLVLWNESCIDRLINSLVEKASDKKF